MYTLGNYQLETPTDKKYTSILKKHGNIVSLHDITSGITHTGSNFKRSLLVTDQGVLIYTDSEVECDSAVLAHYSVDISLKTQIPAGQVVIGSKLVLANSAEIGPYFRLYLQVPKQKYRWC